MTYLDGYGWTTTVAPAGGFLPPNQYVWQHLNFDGFTPSDVADYAAALLPAAVELIERETNTVFLRRTIALTLAGFPCPPCGSPLRDYAIRVPLRPVHQVTSLAYTDADGQAATLTGLQTWLDHKPPLVLHAAGGSWPATKSGALQPVTLTLVAGYAADWNGLPTVAQRAALLIVGYWFEHRGDGRDPTTWAAASVLASEMGVPMGAARLIDSLRDREYH